MTLQGSSLQAVTQDPGFLYLGTWFPELLQQTKRVPGAGTLALQFLGLEVTQIQGTVRYSPFSQEGEKSQI